MCLLSIEVASFLKKCKLTCNWLHGNAVGKFFLQTFSYVPDLVDISGYCDFNFQLPSSLYILYVDKGNEDNASIKTTMSKQQGSNASI